jgi:hypothetical protein
MKTVREDFSFGKMAPTFRRHIEDSIPGYKAQLVPECVRQSVRFVHRSIAKDRKVERAAVVGHELG